jgi:hypothetical protein
MSKTHTLIDKQRSCHHSRDTVFRPPLFPLPSTPCHSRLITKINVIAPRANKIHGSGMQCYMSKQFTVYYKTFWVMNSYKMNGLKLFI